MLINAPDLTGIMRMNSALHHKEIENLILKVNCSAINTSTLFNSRVTRYKKIKTPFIKRERIS